MSALIESAGQYKFLGSERLNVFCSVAAIQGKQDRQVTLATANPEVPSGIGFGPGDIHKSPVSLPSREERELTGNLVRVHAGFA